MRNGICPKCGSHEVYTNENVYNRSNMYGMNAIPIKSSFLPSTATLTNYACVQCGYVESYLTDMRKAEEIKGQWAKIAVE